MVPNILSLSRVAIAPFIVLSAVSNNWQLAFVLIVIGLATDWFDGWLAVKLNAQSDFGAKVLEPYCDFALTIGAVGGLVLVGIVSWELAIALAVIAVAAYFVTIVPAPHVLVLFCNGFLPFYYLSVILAVAGVYAAKAFGIHALWLLPPALIVGIMAAKIKKDRLRTWLHGG